MNSKLARLLARLSSRGAARPGKNPFQPGRGVLPPLLAGRDEELALAEQRLTRLADGASPAEDLLFYGPRGNGKTTLLLEIRRRAGERGFRVETLPVTTLTDDAKLVRLLQERVGSLESQVTGVQTAGFGTTTTPRVPSEDLDALLTAWIGPRASIAPPMVVILDEVQESSPETARPFWRAIQEAKTGAAPFLVLAAGTPDAPRRIIQSGTFNDRGFEKIRVGRLRRSDTIAALRVPARESGRPITEDAAAFLAEKSQDYPYFIQLLGSAAWEAAAADTEISLRHAKRGAAKSAARIEDFYENRYREARARGVASALKPVAHLFRDHGGRLDDQRLEPLLRRLADDGATPFDYLALEEQLSDLGVLWTPRAGVWEMGIPSFADYLLSRA